MPEPVVSADQAYSLLDSIRRWSDAASNEVDDIATWRNAEPGDREYLYWPTHNSPPKLFDADTVAICGAITSYVPKLDADPVLTVAKWIDMWYRDSDGRDLPSTNQIKGTLNESLRIIWTLDNSVRRWLMITGEPEWKGEGRGGKADKQGEQSMVGRDAGDEHDQPPAETPASDTPDKLGYVLRPSDSNAYVPFKNVLNNYTPHAWSFSTKQIIRIIEDFSRNHVRWTRPLDKSGQPIRNRRSIHLGDWHTFLQRANHEDSEGFPPVSNQEVNDIKSQIKSTKNTRK